MILRARVTDQEARGLGTALLSTRCTWGDARELPFCERGAVPVRAEDGPAGSGRLFTKKDGWIHYLPSIGARWTMTRDLRGLPSETFREWWASRGKEGR